MGSLLSFVCASPLSWLRSLPASGCAVRRAGLCAAILCRITVQIVTVKGDLWRDHGEREMGNVSWFVRASLLSWLQSPPRSGCTVLRVNFFLVDLCRITVQMVTVERGFLERKLGESHGGVGWTVALLSCCHATPHAALSPCEPMHSLAQVALSAVGPL